MHRRAAAAALSAGLMLVAAPASALVVGDAEIIITGDLFYDLGWSPSEAEQSGLTAEIYATTYEAGG